MLQNFSCIFYLKYLLVSFLYNLIAVCRLVCKDFSFFGMQRYVYQRPFVCLSEVCSFKVAWQNFCFAEESCFYNLMLLKLTLCADCKKHVLSSSVSSVACWRASSLSVVTSVTVVLSESTLAPSAAIST